MKLWLNILLVCCACGFAKADAPYSVIDSGNAAYAKEKYAKAIEYYKRFEESGYQSEQVYYNMGNCYYRMNEIAKSILYYEKAKKLNPSDADVQFNLQLANAKTSSTLSGTFNSFSRATISRMRLWRTAWNFPISVSSFELCVSRK